MKKLFMLLLALAALGAVITIARNRRASEEAWGEGDWANAYGGDAGLSVATGDVRATAGATS
jgi:hypothetical protein